MLVLAQRNNEVPHSEIRLIYNKILGRTDVIDLTVGIPDFDTPKHIIEETKRALDEERGCVESIF